MNIFIAKLNSITTSEGLNEIFSQFGTVTNAKVIMDKETGRSKCYGFVEMSNDEEARNAITELHDSELDGNVIVVRESEPKGRSESGGNRQGGFSRNRPRINDRPQRFERRGGGGFDSGSGSGYERKPFNKNFKSKGYESKDRFERDSDN